MDNGRIVSDLDLAIRFFFQLGVILVVCRAVSWAGKFLGQTQVVCEMLAGVFLGPSLLGLIAPQMQAALFPKTVTVGGEVINHPSMSILYVISQLGLVLYMFVVGLEFDHGFLKHRGKSALMVSLSGILAPVVIGGGLGLVLHRSTESFTSGVTPWSGAFFVGAAMSITAFPMLARIISETGMSKTSMGSLALGAAAFDDAVAWCLLAVVLTTTKGDPGFVIKAIGGGMLFAVLTMTIGAKLLTRLEEWYQREQELSNGLMITVMGLLLGSAWVTDSLGIYAVFGAFIFGAAMPQGKLAEELDRRIKMLVSNLLLPLFFVYSGLNTKISLVNTPFLVLMTVLIVVVAILAKGLACTLAARAAGEQWPDAAKIGTLMNSRGLIELIILNIGLQRGVITPTLFTMMVIMAIVTTLMASPLFMYLQRRYPTPNSA